MIDNNLKPYLIEVNHSPSFTTDTPLDHNIKMNLIKDTIILMNFKTEDKVFYRNKFKAEM
jgi:tubulin polyglutamylase TTLL6/13